MSLRAGNLRERVAIQALTRSLDNQGGYSSSATYATITNGTVWAKVDAQDSVVETRGQAQVQVIRYTVEIRYRSGLTTDHRLTWGSRTFRILGIRDPLSRHEKLLLTCEEAPGAAT